MTTLQYLKTRLLQEQGDLKKYQMKISEARINDRKDLVEIYERLIVSAYEGIDFFSKQVREMEAVK